MIHLPWFFAIIKVFASYSLLLLVHWLISGYSLSFGWDSVAMILLGFFYVHSFKYFWHRYPMHRRLPFLGAIKKSHESHHRSFHGSFFRSREPEKLADIISDPPVFPVLLFVNYLASLLILPWRHIPAFFLAVSLWFAFFEATHWLTHLNDNFFDRFMKKVGLGGIWNYVVDYHREHHDHPNHNFHFLPPFIWDILCHTFKSVKNK